MNAHWPTPALLLALVAAACGADGAAVPDTTSDSADKPAIDALSVGSVSGRIPVIVDYSPTSSDVAALLYVSQHPSADLLAVTLAGTGESHCEQGVANTRALLASVGMADIPVACGREQPIGPGNEWPAAWRDAADRLDGLDLDSADENADDGNSDETDAADLLASVASENSPVTIIALAPLTNLAVAIERHADLPTHVADVITMGGAVEVDGNAPDDAAEWNYFIDPTAVDVVLRSGIPVTMVPLDATDDVPVTKAWFDELAAHRTTVAANAVHDLFAASRPFDLGFFFWDEFAAAVAFDETVATFDERAIVVEVAGSEQGQTRLDPDGTSVRVALTASTEHFERQLLTTLNGGAEPPEIQAASPAEVDYFQAVEASVATLSAGLEDLFHTPLALEIEEIANRGDEAELEPGDEDMLREFFTTFWTGAAQHVALLRDELHELDPPDSVRAEHDDYVTAIGAVVDDNDQRLADIRNRDATELLTSFWEPDASIDAVTTACEALGSAAFLRGVDAVTCPQ